MMLANSLALTQPRNFGAAGPDPLNSYGKGAVATRTQPYFNSSSTNTATISRTWTPMPQNLTKLGVTVGDAKLSTSTAAETYARTGSTITWEAWWEYPAGTYTRITFGGGNTSGTTTNGTILESDELTLPGAYTSGDDCWIWLRAANASGGVYYNGWRHSAKGEGLRTGTSGIETEPGPSITFSNNTMPPLVVWSSECTTASALVIGDSKNAGFNDRALSQTASGYLQRGLLSRCIADGVVYNNISSGGSRAGNNVGDDWTTAWGMRKLILKYYSHFFFALGYNDLFVDSQTAATLLTAVEACLADITTANTYARITMQTIGPRSSSTSGGWTSLADQTAAANEAARITHNSSIRAGSITGNNNGYFEVANLIDAGGADAGKWAMPSVTRSITDAAITALSTTLTSATANFTSADVGVGVSVVGAGAAGAVLNRWISSVSDATTVILDNSAGTTVSGANATIGTPTGDGLHETAERYLVPSASGTIDVSTKMAA